MKRTQNMGTVTALLPGGVVQVRWDGGSGLLPVPEEVLEAVSATPPPPAVKAKPAPTPQPASSEPEEYEGVRLAFDPQLNNEAEPVAFEVYLLNGTPHKILYELKVLTGTHRRWAKAGQLEAGGKKRLEAVAYGWLNEKLSCELDCRPILPEGPGPRHFQQLRIKGQQFFDKLEDVPELYRDAHLYVVFPSLDTTATAPALAPTLNTDSLKAITQQELNKKPVAPAKNLAKLDLAEKLEFETEIDLHLPALVKDPDAVPKHMVLQTQLKHLDAYLERAVRLGVDRVYVIHGVGSGALKRAIHSRLHGMRYVRDFRNDFHPKYGTGATEVIFD